MWVRVGSWQRTRASGWAPWRRPSVTPAKAGWKSEPWPSMTSQWSGSFAGLSHSTAPEMKSATTASMATPSPEIMIPVWPVPRKVAFMPRARISFSSASAVYFLPQEQSVPTVRTRLPLRFTPVAVAKRWVGWRTSKSRTPHRPAASAIAGTSPNR